MSLKKCVLNGKKIVSLDALYEALSDRLELPDYFGRNLDALWDLLSGYVEGPFEIIWKDADASKKHLGKDFEQVITLLKELAQERDDFKLKIEK